MAAFSTAPEILAVAEGQNIAVIDRGKADHLQAGLTFDVYALGKGAQKVYKGVITVLDVDAGTAREVARELGRDDVELSIASPDDYPAIEAASRGAQAAGSQDSLLDEALALRRRLVEDETRAAIAAGDVALLLDYQVRHVLVDEMQDTSRAQYRLLAQ